MMLFTLALHRTESKLVLQPTAVAKVGSFDSYLYSLQSQHHKPAFSVVLGDTKELEPRSAKIAKTAQVSECS